MNKLLVTLLLSSAITLSVQAQKSEGYYVKHVEFPQNATLEQKSGYGCTSRAHPSTICLATNGIDSFPSFWYQHLYRT